MYNIYLLGSASGVYPDYKRRYTSWLLQEKSGKYLMFDCGSGSVESSYCLGIDPLLIDKIFITHPHTDHTGGLTTFLGFFIKRMWDVDEFASKRTMDFYSPCPKSVEGARLMLEAEFADMPVIVNHHEISPGHVYEDDEVTIDCLPTLHRNYRNGKPTCYGYRITFRDGRRIIFTGDFKNIDEFAPWLSEGCDLLMLETGHHTASTLCETIRHNNWHVKELFFIHHGLAMLDDMEGERRRAEEAWGAPVIIGEDSMLYTF